MTDLSAEDAKLITLARASRARIGAAQGAAVRDLDGRTYAASTVSLPSLEMAALDLAVSMAVSSGAKGLEAAAVVGGEALMVDTARDLGGAGVPVHRADDAGELIETRTT